MVPITNLCQKGWLECISPLDTNPPYHPPPSVGHEVERHFSISYCINALFFPLDKPNMSSITLVVFEGLTEFQVYRVLWVPDPEDYLEVYLLNGNMFQLWWTAGLRNEMPVLDVFKELISQLIW